MMAFRISSFSGKTPLIAGCRPMKRHSSNSVFTEAKNFPHMLLMAFRFDGFESPRRNFLISSDRIMRICSNDIVSVISWLLGLRRFLTVFSFEVCVYGLSKVAQINNRATKFLGKFREAAIQAIRIVANQFAKLPLFLESLTFEAFFRADEGVALVRWSELSTTEPTWTFGTNDMVIA